jgi:L-aspartate oxidase
MDDTDVGGDAGTAATERSTGTDAGADVDPIETDVLVIGSGIAGCTAALAAARAGADVTVVTKASRPADAATDWAQGGIAVTRSSPDSFRADVLAAGDGECDPDAVDVLVSEARDAVTDVLVDAVGVAFDVDGDGEASDADDPLAACHFGREGGHSERRILHVDAATGRHVLRPFLGHIEGHADVQVAADTAVLELLTREGRAYGALVEREGAVRPAFASATVLATGGIGACFPDSTNPAGATGDGLAMAALAGADLADLAYVQFHPTAYDGDDPFLVSEAVRGEGAVLRNGDGERFMPAVHDDADLAPRDVVARAVARERAATGEVRLDVSPLDFAGDFPGLADRCRERGVDPADGVPVAPAEHFHCGGVAVDDRGRTSLDRLFAAGEVARTGVHGANRLASTSLLEGLVWGRRAGATAAAAADGPARVEVALPVDTDPPLPDGFADAKFERLRRVIGAGVGIERTPAGIERARAGLRRLKGEVDAYVRTRTSRRLYELRNAVVAGLLVARAAADAPSAGCHRLVDEAAADDAAASGVAD